MIGQRTLGGLRLTFEIMLLAAMWVAAIIDLVLHLATMNFLPAFALGSMVFVIPFHIWRDIPKLIDGYQQRKKPS